MPTIDHSDARSFYSAILACLRFVEARTPTGRRFGADADALWKQLSGHLATADRLDLLLRDADGQWHGAFATRSAFRLRGVASDDALGPEWEGLDPVLAEEMWRETVAKPAPASVTDVLNECAAAWGLRLRPFDVGTVSANSRLVVAGPSAIVATALVFATQSGLSWADQVTVVATPAGHRHLAALAAAVLNTTEATRLLAADDAKPKGRADRVLVSDDVDARDREAVGARGAT